MATTEFEQTGSTSGQRAAALAATEPAGKPGRPPQQAIDVAGSMSAANDFVSDFMDRNPAAVPQPKEDPYADMSDADLTQLIRRLNNDGVEHTMSPEQAEQVSALLES